MKKLLHADHVDNERGTGFVHTAPAHGEEDFELAKKYNLKIEDLLDENGYYKENIPLVGLKSVKEAEVAEKKLLVAKLDADVKKVKDEEDKVKVEISEKIDQDNHWYENLKY